MSDPQDDPVQEVWRRAFWQPSGDPAFLFYLPGVYRKVFSPNDSAESGAYTQFLTSNVVEGDRAMIGTFGGLEANYVHAWWINARIVRAAPGGVPAASTVAFGPRCWITQ